MKKTASTLLIGVIVLFSACTKDPVEEELDRDYEIVREELNVAYGDHPSHRMDIYYPEDYSDQTRVVFLIHGGGFIAGDKEGFTNVARLFARKGFVSVNLNHRLIDGTGLDLVPPLHRSSAVKVRDQVEDLARAVDFFRASIEEWGLGTSHMYMAGHSAGGTLAMLYVQGEHNAKNESAPESKAKVRASGNFAGLANVTLSEALYANPPEHPHWPAVKELLYRMSGAEVVHSNALALMAISPNWVTINHRPGWPHITVMSNTNDQDLQFYPHYNTVADAEAYHEQLKSYGTPSEYVLMNTDHGFGNHPEDWAKAVAHVTAFFRKK